MNHIMTAADYLLDMTHKLQHHLQEVDIHAEETNVSDLLLQVVKLNEPLCAPRNIEISAFVDDALATCQMDRMYVTEVMNSLVKNAIDAIADSGRIQLTLTQEKKAIVVSVIDNGKGIDSADLPFVMDPFYTTKKRMSNFGLGLTQGYNIMRQHNGELLIDSVEGKGTTVRLVFPMKRRGRKFVNGLLESKPA
jgi:signal transduction histidine kinase